jgi:hypothetical protein
MINEPSLDNGISPGMAYDNEEDRLLFSAWSNGISIHLAKGGKFRLGDPHLTADKEDFGFVAFDIDEVPRHIRSWLKERRVANNHEGWLAGMVQEYLKRWPL